jgi:hypothetical protein
MGGGEAAENRKWKAERGAERILPSAKTGEWPLKLGTAKIGHVDAETSKLSRSGRGDAHGLVEAFAEHAALPAEAEEAAKTGTVQDGLDLIVIARSYDGEGEAVIRVLNRRHAVFVPTTVKKAVRRVASQARRIHGSPL